MFKNRPNLLKNKLMIFMLKRAAVLYIIILVLDIMIIGKRWTLLTGLTLGSVLSFSRFISMNITFSRLLPSQKNMLTPKRSILNYVINQVIAIALLFTAAWVNLWLFAGLSVGIMLVPFVVMINSLTEYFNITHNNFE